MEASQKLTIEVAPWCMQARECFLHPIIRTRLETLKHAADDGRMFRVEHDGRLVGFFALEYLGAEMLLMAAVGRDPGVDLTDAVLPWLEAEAAAVGFESLRIHTRRAGLGKKLAARGYDAEMVLRKEFKA